MYTLSANSANLLAVNIGSIIPFNNINTQNPTCKNNFVAGSNTISLGKGTYCVHVNADILGTTAGVVKLQLLNNNVAVVGASASETAVVGATANVGFDAIIKVNGSCKCVDNTARLQVQLQTTTATISNINVTVVQICSGGN